MFIAVLGVAGRRLTTVAGRVLVLSAVLAALPATSLLPLVIGCLRAPVSVPVAAPSLYRVGVVGRQGVVLRGLWQTLVAALPGVRIPMRGCRCGPPTVPLLCGSGSRDVRL